MKNIMCPKQNWRALLLLSVMALYALTPAFAQIPFPGLSQPNPSQQTTTDSLSPNDSLLQQFKPNPLLQSPKHTVQTFLKGFETWENTGKPLSLSTMDLEFINKKIRFTQGIHKAEMLKTIFDLIPKSKVKAPSSIHTDFWVLAELPAGNITMSKNNVGDWKFSRESLENLEPIFQDVTQKYKAQMDSLVKQKNFSTGFKLYSNLLTNAPILVRSPFLLPNWQWIALLLMIILGAIIHGFTSLFAHKILNRLIWKRMLDTKNLEKGIGKPLGMVLAIFFWQSVLPIIGLPAQAQLVLLVAVRFLFSFATIWALWKISDWICDNLAEKAHSTESKFDDLLVPILRTGFRIFVIATGLLIIADALDLPIYTIVSGMTIGSVAFALAAKDTVENLFGSITVLLDRPFHIGDWIVIGDVEGTVENLGFRSTRIRTFYDSLISVPNSNLIKATVDNMGNRRYRRILTTLGIEYSTPPEKITTFVEGIRQLIREHPYTRKDYFHVYFNAFNSSSLDIMVYCFVKAPDWSVELREKERLFLDIMRLAQTLKVNFAFPTQTLHLHNSQEDSPKDSKLWTEHEIRNLSHSLASAHFLPDGSKPGPVQFP
jgi:MscS family membrane protein